jgi:archaellum biogenesis protein FlaJ (TadC family)
MNREQKQAWAMVISMSLALILIIVAGVLYLFEADSPHLLIYAAVVVLVSGVVVCLRVKPDKGAVTSDERDKQIEKNANLAGFGAVYLFVIVASFAPIAILGEDGSIPATLMPALLIGAGMCQAYAKFVAILIQYGRGEKGENS